jgi:ribosomal protein S18 acetylase RimI-like enzyme
MSTWGIRRGTQADTSSVLDLWLAADTVPTATDSETGLAHLLRHDPDALLLAVADERIVGSLIASWDGWRGSFYRLAVHPDWRRQGLATDLVRAGEDRLRELGAVRLTAIVADGESGAAELWTAAGYERQNDRSRFVRMAAD